MATEVTAKAERSQPNKLTWAGLALVLPSTMFWLATIGGGLLHRDALAQPFLSLAQRYDMWFVIGVLLVMPLLGGILAAIGFRRKHLTMGIVVMLLGFGAAALNILLQTAPRPVQ